MNLFWTLVVAVSMVLGGCMYVSESAERESTLNVTAIDVGQGLAVLLEWDGRYAMYDFGPDSVGVVDSLVARGVDTLDWVVLSHFHRDHIGGFMELPGRGVFVRRLYVGADTSCSFFCDSVLRVARSMGSLIDTLLRGESVSFGEGANGLTAGGNVVAGAEWIASDLKKILSDEHKAYYAQLLESELSKNEDSPLLNDMLDVSDGRNYSLFRRAMARIAQILRQ
jgi:competence protein ComEC